MHPGSAACNVDHMRDRVIMLESLSNGTDKQEGASANRSMTPGPIILEKRAWQVAVSGAVCGIVLRRLSVVSAPSLFALHVACMAPMLPLAVASISTVRQRLRKPSNVPPSAPRYWRKQRAEWLVIRHFVTSAAALYLSAGGLVAIWRHKVAIGRPHLTTVHAWSGLATWGAWLAAYLIAQPQVWRDQIKARRFSLLSNKRWLWASVSHRRAGTLSFVALLVAYTTGIWGWRAIDQRTSVLCVLAVLSIGAGTMNEHSSKEAARAVTSAIRRPLKASRALMAQARSRSPRMMSTGDRSDGAHDDDCQPEGKDLMDAGLRRQLIDMQVRNQRNGVISLGVVCVLIAWFFSVPPDIRRSKICLTEVGNTKLTENCVDASVLANRIIENYTTCGTETACVQFDLSVDPETRSSVAALASDLLRGTGSQ